MLMLAPPPGERPVQTLRHQRGPALGPSQQAQEVPGDATWLGPCQLRGVIPRLGILCQ